MKLIVEDYTIRNIKDFNRNSIEDFENCVMVLDDMVDELKEME